MHLFKLQFPNSNERLDVNVLGKILKSSLKKLPASTNSTKFSSLYQYQYHQSNILNGRPEWYVDSYYYKLCSKIDFIKFSSSSRPWNCTVNLDIFPKKTCKFKERDFSGIWFWPLRPDQFGSFQMRYTKCVPYYMTFISIPPLNLLSLPERFEETCPDISSYWVKSITENFKRIFGQLDMFLIIIVKLKEVNDVQNFTQSRVYAKKFYS